MNSLPSVTYVHQPNVWPPRKIAVVSTIVVIALGAIASGVLLEGMGGISIGLFSGGSALILIDAGICIHSFWKLRQFYRAVDAFDLNYPFERFAPYDNAFDFYSFSDQQARLYTVIYAKKEGRYSALFFFNDDYYRKRLQEVMDTHTHVPLNM